MSAIFLSKVSINHSTGDSLEILGHAYSLDPGQYPTGNKRQHYTPQETLLGASAIKCNQLVGGGCNSSYELNC